MGTPDTTTASSIAKTLNSLPGGVAWDRASGDPAHWLAVYGWIDRGDGTRDFLTISFQAGFPVGYITSSAEHSIAFGEALGFDTAGHRPCQKILEILPDVAAVVPWQKP